jgi:hypothetical protein
MARLDDLRDLRADLRSRMAECESDQNFAVMGRLLSDVLKQIDDLDPANAAKPAAGQSGSGGVVVDFTSRLAHGAGASS